MEQVFTGHLTCNVGLCGGDNNWIKLRWCYEKLKRISISADFNSLKHLNIDETADALDIKLDIKDAFVMAGHTTPVITIKHYPLNEKERQHERLRKVNNSFVKKLIPYYSPYKIMI